MSATTPESFQLSPRQTRLIQMGKWTDERPAIVHGRIRITGEVTPGAVARAWRRIVLRHEILRTVFPTLPGLNLPTQAIGEKDPTLWLPHADLSSLERSALEGALEELTAKAVEIPWNLAEGPLVRLCLATQGPKDLILLVTVPALVADGPSLGVVTRELASELDGAVEATTEPLQYADLAAWQNDLLESPESEGGRAFWRHRTEHLSPTGLPLAHGDHSPRPERTSTRIGGDRTERVLAIADRFDVAPADLLLAAWAVALRERTDSPELNLGVTLTGRTFEELQEAVGPLAGPIPVECTPRTGETWHSLASRLRAAREEAEDRQEYFEWTAGATGPDAEPSGYPLGFEYEALGPVSLRDATLTLVETRTWDEPADVRLTAVHSSADDLALHIDFDPRRVEPTQAEFLLQAVIRVVESLAADPEATVDSVSTLGPAEHDALLVEPNSDTAPLPSTTVLGLVEDQAADSPDRVAVVSGEVCMTYGELDRRATSLARRLGRVGAQPESRIGLLLDRSPSMLVALLATWKTGAAYVAVDPTFPPERMAVVLDGVPVLVTDAQEAELPNEFSGEIVRLDSDPSLDEEPTTPLAGTADPEHLAYVLYTSGSTGRPKGVAISHLALLNYTLRTGDDLGTADGPPSRFLNLTTLAADLGHTTIFPALASGGTVVLMSYEDATDVLGFSDFIANRRIDVVKITPSHLAVLLTSAGDGALPSSVIIGGEAFPRTLAKRIAKREPRCRLVNEYGPTEATVGCVAYDFEGRLEVAIPGASVPIGRPLPNTRAYVLDARLAPLPAGGSGELFLAGECLARGYLGRASETAARFLPDPFSERPSARMYRTGDRARHLAGGLLDCLGRLDHQVKIRGFRVELGEVEAICLAQPGVREAVAMLDAESPETGLKAFVVREEPGPLRDDEADALLEGMRRRLPEVMIPSAVVAVESMPLTVNGKIDRAALAEIGSRQSPVRPPHEAPRDEIEEALATVWAEVLEDPEIGIDDNFFALGGDSIRSIRLRYLAQEAGLHFSTQDLFRHPTIRLLAPLVKPDRGVDEELQRVDSMSDEEVDDLLEDLLNEDGRAP